MSDASKSIGLFVIGFAFLFAIVEVHAIFNSRPGDTLSAGVWWTLDRMGRWSWLVRIPGIILFAWLTYHFFLEDQFRDVSGVK